MAGSVPGTVASAPAFAAGRANRAVETRLVDGLPQVATWDLDSGDRRLLTGHPHGADLSEIEPDGEFVWWFDADGTGRGVWCRQPFGGGDAEPALRGVPRGLPRGAAFSRDGRLAAACAGAGEGSRCFLGAPGGPAAEVYSAPGYRCLVDLSPDGTLLAFAGPPGGPDAIVLADVRAGATASLGGDEGQRLWPLEFRSGPGGAPELLVMVETSRDFTVATWTAGAGLRLRPHLAFAATATAGWYPGGDRVLVQHELAGRSRLLLADTGRPRVEELPVPRGTVHDLSCAPDGSVHYLWSRTGMPAAQLVTGPGRRAACPPGEAAAPSPTSELWTTTSYGTIHSFVTVPAGGPPWPAVFLIHGGPATHDRDCTDPRVEALTSAGYAVVRTNYRGSTGYGPQWQHGHGHRVGLAQAEDLAAVRGHLLSEGIAAAHRTALFGYSWGGYLALLAMGLQPGLWSAAVAAYPIADYARCFATTTPSLREVDIGLFGGTPEQFPARYAAASPISYAARVRGPVLLIGARDDERCPSGQIEAYARALAGRGVPLELVWRDGGHAGRHLDEQASIMSLALGFLRRWPGEPFRVPGRARAQVPSGQPERRET
jgi:dienelactone hydrolase